MISQIPVISPVNSVIDASISPITALQSIIQPILRYDYPEQTLSEALGKPPALLLSDLKKISSADEEIAFNYDGYRLLYNLERFLRDLIYQKICVPCKKMIQNKINVKVIQKWEERKNDEERNPLMKKGYRLIDYSDFGDLKGVFLKGKNEDLFSDLFSGEQFKNFISKLNELDPIRNKIAHSRPLSKDEFDRLQMYANDITQLLT